VTNPSPLRDRIDRLDRSKYVDSPTLAIKLSPARLPMQQHYSSCRDGLRSCSPSLPTARPSQMVLKSICSNSKYQPHTPAGLSFHPPLSNQIPMPQERRITEDRSEWHHSKKQFYLLREHKLGSQLGHSLEGCSQKYHPKCHQCSRVYHCHCRNSYQTMNQQQ